MLKNSFSFHFMLNNTQEKLSGFWLAESSAVFSWLSEKTRKKCILKCCDWQCTETMQFCLSIKCEICFHVHRRWFYFVYCLWLEKAKSLICFTWILRRQHLKHTRHHCMEYDQAWTAALFHLSNNKDFKVCFVEQILHVVSHSFARLALRKMN